MPGENRLRWGILVGSVLVGLVLGYAGVVCCEQAASCTQPTKQPCKQPSNQTAKQPAKSAPAAAATKTASTGSSSTDANDI